MNLTDISTPWRRFLAWVDMHFVDHGVARAVYNNFHALGGGMYRCSQPSPAQIRKYHRRYGIRTIINLRGQHDYGSYFYEEETCRELGIALIDIKLYSRIPPEIEEVHAMEALFRSIEYPALMHCKSGADRAGLGAALYRTLQLGQPVEEAKRELSWIYGHFSHARTGVLDFFFEQYLAYRAHTPIAFMEWVDTIYNHKALRARFHADRGSAWLVDKILRRE